MDCHVLYMWHGIPLWQHNCQSITANKRHGTYVEATLNSNKIYGRDRNFLHSKTNNSRTDDTPPRTRDNIMLKYCFMEPPGQKEKVRERLELKFTVYDQQICMRLSMHMLYLFIHSYISIISKNFLYAEQRSNNIV